jgi:hypothetical protein
MVRDIDSLSATLKTFQQSPSLPTDAQATQEGIPSQSVSQATNVPDEGALGYRFAQSTFSLRTLGLRLPGNAGDSQALILLIDMVSSRLSNGNAAQEAATDIGKIRSALNAMLRNKDHQPSVVVFGKVASSLLSYLVAKYSNDDVNNVQYYMNMNRDSQQKSIIDSISQIYELDEDEQFIDGAEGRGNIDDRNQALAEISAALSLVIYAVMDLTAQEKSANQLDIYALGQATSDGRRLQLSL